ncbi:hypothetical protein DL93DRAFT_2158554 [Clavulina sp. PMI_390]|nr:hypothetical protein DL93DRAFT_2158554 [Clavulina sp. PMI_390]
MPSPFKAVSRSAKWLFAPTPLPPQDGATDRLIIPQHLLVASQPPLVQVTSTSVASSSAVSDRTLVDISLASTNFVKSSSLDTRSRKSSSSASGSLNGFFNKLKLSIPAAPEDKVAKPPKKTAQRSLARHIKTDLLPSPSISPFHGPARADTTASSLSSSSTEPPTRTNSTHILDEPCEHIESYVPHKPVAYTAVPKTKSLSPSIPTRSNLLGMLYNGDLSGLDDFFSQTATRDGVMLSYSRSAVERWVHACGEPAVGGYELLDTHDDNLPDTLTTTSSSSTHAQHGHDGDDSYDNARKSNATSALVPSADQTADPTKSDSNTATGTTEQVPSLMLSLPSIPFPTTTSLASIASYLDPLSPFIDPAQEGLPLSSIISVTNPTPNAKTAASTFPRNPSRSRSGSDPLLTTLTTLSALMSPVHELEPSLAELGLLSPQDPDTDPDPNETHLQDSGGYFEARPHEGEVLELIQTSELGDWPMEWTGLQGADVEDEHAQLL